jgi:hypothetical protein
MKKVNLLIGVLYINTLMLIAINTYFLNIFIDMIMFFITKKEPELINYNDPAGFFKLFQIISPIWFIIYIVLSIINIIALVSDYKNNDLKILFNKMKRIKIGLIPYWIINFICYLPISMVWIVAGHGFGFIVVPIFIFASYTVLILTSIFSIVYLNKLQKNNIIIKKQFILHTILQLFFVIDIIDIIYILKKWSKPGGT